MFRLPGYIGGAEDRLFPPDVVARMIPGDLSDGAWLVDFRVADVEAATAKAASNGGEVISVPDAGLRLRTSMLSDPGGAAFSISQVTS